MRVLDDFSKNVVNQNTKSKRADNFYVTFLGVPENYSNILGRQLKTITRPPIDVQTFNQRYRAGTRKNNANLLLAPLTMSFYDDEESITSMIIYAMLFRQLNKYPDKFGKWGLDRDYRFDIQISFFNSNRVMTEEVTYKDCIIQTLDHTAPSVNDPTECEIDLTVEYNNVDIKIFDEFLSLIKEKEDAVTNP